MTVHLIAHPFRLGNDGRVQCHEQDSEAYLAERIALILGTRPGERPLVPAFGINDPAFDELSLAGIQNQMTIFEIPVEVTGLTRNDVDNTTASYRVTFEQVEEQDT